jgi:hypothetical protein
MTTKTKRTVIATHFEGKPTARVMDSGSGEYLRIDTHPILTAKKDRKER